MDQEAATAERDPTEQPIRVLVVDDEPSITELVATVLRYEGFQVEVAGNGWEALRQASEFRPDLIVLDVMLPDHDGFEVHRRLRERGEEIPVIFLTARDATEDKVRGLTVGGTIELRPTEFKLLRYLMLNPRRVLSKQQILDHVWHYDFGGDSNVVETYISYLRKKVDAVEPHLIHTVRGAGYVLRLPRQ